MPKHRPNAGQYIEPMRIQSVNGLVVDFSACGSDTIKVKVQKSWNHWQTDGIRIFSMDFGQKASQIENLASRHRSTIT